MKKDKKDKEDRKRQKSEKNTDYSEAQKKYISGIEKLSKDFIEKMNFQGLHIGGIILDHWNKNTEEVYKVDDKKMLEALYDAIDKEKYESLAKAIEKRLNELKKKKK